MQLVIAQQEKKTEWHLAWTEGSDCRFGVLIAIRTILEIDNGFVQNGWCLAFMCSVCQTIFYIPAASTPQLLDSQEVAVSSFPAAVNGQYSECPVCHLLASNDGEQHLASFTNLVKKWPKLPPHIKETISVLIDSVCSQEPNSNEDI